MAAASLDEETAAAVLRQIEYYFSDNSLPGDTFLLEKIKASDDDMVDLALLCSFQKMRSHLKVKETDPARFPADKVAAMAEVLRKSTFLKLSENGQRVGRVTKLRDPEVIRAEKDARSIAANPFPYNMGMEKVEAVFKPHAQVKNVRLPKHKNVDIPSGFAVIELSSKEEAEKVLEMELTCNGVTLKLEPKTAFDARKQTLLENDKGNEKAQKREKSEKQSEKQEDTEEEMPKGLIVSFTAKKIGASDETEKVAQAEKAAEAADTEGEEDEEGEKLSREDIKEGLAKFGIIKYVDYAKGKESGFLRFADPEDAQKLRAAAGLEAQGGLTIANHLVTFEALEGEAEEEYWKKVKEGQGQKKRSFGGGGRGFGGGRGRGGGGRRGGRGGRGGRARGSKRAGDGEGPRSKSQKTD